MRAWKTVFPAILLAIVTQVVPSLAQDYPSKPIQIFMGFPAGSGLDIVSRYYANHIQKMTGTTVVVQNRVGANGMIAMAAVAKSPPDGHTIVFGPGASAAHVVIKSLGFDPQKDLVPLGSLVAFPFFLVVDSAKPYKTASELAAALKLKGKVSHASANSLSHVGGVLFAKDNGIDAAAVPYKSNNDVIRDILSGDLDYAFNEANSSLAMMREGKLRALGVTLQERSANAPDVPTMKELGYQDFGFHGFMAAYAPAGTPQPILAKLEKWVVEIGRSEETAAFYKKIGADKFSMTAAEFAAWEQTEFAAWKVRAKIANLEAN